ncbi:MAG: hypothetical protein AABX71_02160 [Nanoarchaeota archaeon]
MQKAILVSLIAVLTVISLMTLVVANDLNVSIDRVDVDDMNVVGGAVAGEAGEIVPVDVYFTANEDASDVVISVWMQGERSDGTEIDFRDLIDNRKYHAKLALRLPNDLDETEEDLTLYVRIETDEGNWEESYTIRMQREPNKAELLFVEVDSKLQAGSTVPVDIVVKNLGRHELEDLVVEVRVPELEISKRAYFGDLDAIDKCPEAEDDCDAEDYQDAAERRLYIKVPANAKAGVYELEVEAMGEDVRELVTKTIEVVGAERASRLFVPVTSKELAVGETKTYDIVIVNSGTNIAVYELIPETAEGVIVSVSEPIVTVAAGLSKTVSVDVKAGSREGTYGFAVDVNSDSQLVERVVLNANVTGRAIGTSNITILTVVLAIIFIVLLIVLIVLLTRKPRTEELEESYY